MKKKLRTAPDGGKAYKRDRAPTLTSILVPEVPHLTWENEDGELEDIFIMPTVLPRSWKDFEAAIKGKVKP